MIEVTRMVVRSFNLDHLDIFWEIAPVPGQEILAYDFYVLRSESAMGPWDVLGGPFQDVYRFRDVQANLLHKYRNLFYKVRVVHVPTGETKEFGPTAHNLPEPDLIAADIIRQEDLLFREFTGRRCWLFPVRTFGPHCVCYDPYTGRRSKNNCPSCFGTGWLGGFLSPIECWVQIEPNVKALQTTALQSQIPSDTVGTMISFPPVKPKDILIESENKRWKVDHVRETQRLRSTVRQMLGLHEIPRGDIEYALPVNVDLLQSPSSNRNFTNRQNTDNEDYSDIFAAYGHPRGVLR